MANVRDLLIRMSLDTATFKRNIADAKGELRTLKSEFKAVSSDSTTMPTQTSATMSTTFFWDAFFACFSDIRIPPDKNLYIV